MMIECKYCGGSGKLHDDADAFDDHERDLKGEVERLTRHGKRGWDLAEEREAEVQRLNSVLSGRALAIQPEVDVLRAENARLKTVVDAAKEIVHCTDCDLEGDGHMTRLVRAVRALAAPQTGGDDA